MRAFIVLALVALARADVGGYTYGTASNGGYASGGGGGGGDIGGANLGGSIGGGSNGGLNLGGLIGGGHLGGGDLGGYHGGDVAEHAVHESAPAELNKEFFTFSAPEAEFDDGKSLGDVANSVKQNLRVIFIRAPESNGLAQAAINLAKSSSDSKTAIYVLTKQADLSGLSNQLQNIHDHNANKPEVHFVKYRTPEDAANAQRAIQQQYDSLGGGPSHSHDGGVAPVLNFASHAPAAPAGHHVISGGVAAPGNSYLAPSHVGNFVGAAAPGNSYVPPAAGVGTPSANYLPIVKLL